jgi:3-hydroxyisobutyrate dehydrogenase-like beta-hydroxyacid dehydrogenase
MRGGTTRHSKFNFKWSYCTVQYLSLSYKYEVHYEVVRGSPVTTLAVSQNEAATMSNVTVIGIGAMGGGMARAMLNSSATIRVVGYDRSSILVDALHQEAKAAEKAAHSPATSLREAVTADTNFVVLVLVNEPQCQQVCFGMDEDSLFSLLPDGSCVILCSTVTGKLARCDRLSCIMQLIINNFSTTGTATWARAARAKFQGRGVHFVDSPVSGGPARAKLGDLTMMASGDDASLEKAKPLLDAMGRDVYIIQGGVGMGSTVKVQ